VPPVLEPWTEEALPVLLHALPQVSIRAMTVIVCFMIIHTDGERKSAATARK
jgi:hypothetical protein